MWRRELLGQLKHGWYDDDGFPQAKHFAKPFTHPFSFIGNLEHSEASNLPEVIGSNPSRQCPHKHHLRDLVPLFCGTDVINDQPHATEYLNHVAQSSWLAAASLGNQLTTVCCLCLQGLSELEGDTHQPFWQVGFPVCSSTGFLVLHIRIWVCEFESTAQRRNH